MPPLVYTDKPYPWEYILNLPERMTFEALERHFPAAAAAVKERVDFMFGGLTPFPAWQYPKGLELDLFTSQLWTTSPADEQPVLYYASTRETASISREMEGRPVLRACRTLWR